MRLLSGARRLVADLSGRSHRITFEHVLSQVDASVDGARLAYKVAAGTVPLAHARASMAVVEHEGDAHRAALVRELARTLTTPIDREDLFRLSRSVDDVLDNLRDFVRESDLYDVSSNPEAMPLLECIAEGCLAMRSAVSGVVHDRGKITSSFMARKKANEVRQLYQLQLAELFLRDLDMTVLKRRELLRRLDVVGLRMVEAANSLSDGLLKRSH